MNLLAFFVFTGSAYVLGRKLALYQAQAGKDGYTFDVQLAAAARLFVEGGIIIAILIAAIRSLTPNP